VYHGLKERACKMPWRAGGHCEGEKIGKKREGLGEPRGKNWMTRGPTVDQLLIGAAGVQGRHKKPYEARKVGGTCRHGGRIGFLEGVRQEAKARVKDGKGTGKGT